ncbi:hypothetical protein DL770_002766 [Monosporascus sp. CRB-9-2]|nr:hypothetical protein DL770_002766 [Monosporascus sp. CRB-9-2]
MMTGIYDLAALQKTVEGVGAVICAYHAHPKAVVEGQLLLIGAGEHAGGKLGGGHQVFHAASWNYDWKRNRLGDHETCDCYISFCNDARTSSTIKPIYGFTGTIPEWELVRLNRPKMIDAASRSTSATGTKALFWTSADDLAAYTIEAVSEPGAADGGFYRVQSFRASPLEMVEAYEQGRGPRLERQSLGSLSEIEDMLVQARASTPLSGHHEDIGLTYAKYKMNGI